MSLLLDALRRAEEDSRKRKLDASATGAGPASMAPSGGTPAEQARTSGAELTLQVQTPPPIPTREPNGAGAQASMAPQAPAPGTDFPDLTLVSDESAAAPLPQAAPPPVTAVADPRAPIQPYGRYARPTGAEAGQGTGPDAGGWAAAQAAREPVRPSTGPFAGRAPVSHAPEATPTEAGSPARVAPVPGTTQRQAISAASAMAGAGVRKAPNKPQRRQWLLAAAALVVALPLAAFLLFGDALFGSSSTLLASKPIVPIVAPQVAAAEASPMPPADAAAPGNLPAAATETTAVAGADKSAPAAAQPVAGVVPSPAPGVAGPTRTSSGPAPVTSRPRVVAQNSARHTAARQAPTGGDGRQRTDATPGGPGVALRPNTAKPASLMDAAYAAYQAGKTTEATRLYQEVLRADPAQRDAWLGLAVIAHASNQREPAMDAYKRVLRLEPQNATALAGLSSLITNAGEPQQESRLREMLARTPQEADLNNALGLVLSGEKRWSEAQPLFFKAHSAAPQEPQFAYNLAVTLDHLRKSGLAAQYYETALGLAQGRASGFDEASARTRLAALKAGAAAGASR